MMRHLYINNYDEVDKKTPSKALQHCKSAPFYIGIPSIAGTPGFMGKLDNIRIYTRALSNDEIHTLYSAYK